MDKDAIQAALAEVKGPRAEQDIVSAGLVAQVEVDGGEVEVLLRFEGVSRADRHAIEDAVHARLEALDGVDEVTIELEVTDLAAPPPEPEKEAGHGHDHGHDHGHKGHGPAADRSALPGVRNIIAVASGKGGVGKSTVAVNLAIALKAKGARVGLLDIDIYGPSAPILLGIAGARPGVSGDQKKFLPVPAYGLSVMSIGFLVEDDTPVIWRGPIVASVVKQFLGDVLWGELDYLVIDLPPGTGDAQLTLTQTVPITGAVIVTTPSELALVDAVKGMQMFRKVDTPVLGIVENMSHYACPDCGHTSEPFNSGGTDRVSKEFDTAILGRIPIDLKIQRGGDEGRPVVAVEPEGPQAAVFLAIADEVIATCPFEEGAAAEDAKKGGFLSSLFRR